MERPSGDIRSREINAGEIQIIRLADGLGFGDGNISPEARLSAESDGLTPEVVEVVESIIEGPNALVDISLDHSGQPVQDDGCSDGRNVGKLWRTIKGVFEKQTLNKSLNRAKVFGGGAIMAFAARVGLGRSKNESFEEAIEASADEVEVSGLSFGLHTATKTSENDSGCGAIDGVPANIAAAEKYRDGIVSATKMLMSDEFDQTIQNGVFENFADFSGQNASRPYSGKKVSDQLSEHGVVVKELAEAHRETHIVINTVKGKTVNQTSIREATNKEADVFAIDEWRLRDICDATHQPGSTEWKTAYMSMLTYTLSTAGDLPVYMVTQSQ